MPRKPDKHTKICFNSLPALLTALLLTFAIVTPASSQPAPVYPSSTSAAVLKPAIQPYHLPPDKLQQAVVLGRVRPALHFASEAWELIVLFLLLATGTASRAADRVQSLTSRGRLKDALYSALLVTLLFFLVDLPISAVGHAVAFRYQISVETWQPWLVDKAKEFALTTLLETFLLMLVFGLMHWRWSHRRPWLWFAVFMAPVALVTTLILPSVVEPLFDTFTPLAQSHPALVAELQRVVARSGTSIPPERMFLMNASEKSNGLNAYVTGFGPTKRIVVWDTTADRMPQDEILFTFAHETGHYVLNHIAKGLAAGAVGIFALSAAVAWTSVQFIRRFGVAWKIASVTSLPGLAVILLAFTLLQDISEPVANTASRFIEHEADVFGQEAIHGVVSDPQTTAVNAFNDLGAAYLDDPNPNPILDFWTESHPSTQSRATFAAQYNPWTSGRQPRFFSK